MRIGGGPSLSMPCPPPTGEQAAPDADHHTEAVSQPPGSPTVTISKKITNRYGLIPAGADPNR